MFEYTVAVEGIREIAGNDGVGEVRPLYVLLAWAGGRVAVILVAVDGWVNWRCKAPWTMAGV